MERAREGAQSSNLSRFLCSLAAHRGLSQSTVHKRLRTVAQHLVSLASVNGWFTGARRPHQADLVALSGVLGIRAESLLAVHALDDEPFRQQPTIGTAMSLWPRMIRGHEKTLLLAGATMLSGITQLYGTDDLSRTTLLVSTLETRQLAALEPEINGGVRESAFLRASWLAAVERLLDLAAAPAAPRIRLWLRSSRQVSRDFRGQQMVGSDWMMIESADAAADDFAVHCFGHAAWPRVRDLFDDLAERDRLWNARLAFDSIWPADDERLAGFARYRRRVAREVTRRTTL